MSQTVKTLVQTVRRSVNTTLTTRRTGSIATVVMRVGPAGADGAAGEPGEPGEPGDAADIAAETHAATEKTTPVDADELGLADSAASWGWKRVSFGNLWAWVIGKFAAMTAGSDRTSVLDGLGAGATGKSLLGAGTVAAALGHLGLGELAVADADSLGGWTNNGNGTYSINVATGYSIATFPVTGLVHGGVYMAITELATVTSGSIQHPGYLNGDPGTTATALSGYTNASGGFRYSITVWSNTMLSKVTLRTNNGFNGTVKKPRIIRIA